jgi:uncharacterized protein (TIGR03000 family)
MARVSSFLTAALLGCGVVLATAGEASAQRRGGGYGRGISIGVGSGGYSRGGFGIGNYGLGGYGIGNYGLGNYGLGGYGYGYRPGISIGIGSGSYYGRGYSSYSPGYYYSSPSYYSSSPNYYSSGYYAVPSGTPYSSGTQMAPEYYESEPGLTQPSSTETQVRVIKPDPSAVLKFDGVQVEGNTDEHVFEYSNEPAGQSYKHTVTAAWNRDGKMVTETRTVQVPGGTSKTVNFTKPAPAAEKVPPTPKQETP